MEWAEGSGGGVDFQDVMGSCGSWTFVYITWQLC